MKEYPRVIMHLVLVEDTETEVLLPDLVEAIRATGAHIYNLPQQTTLMSNKIKVILANIMKSPFHLEDNIIVVHEATFMDIKTNELINDSFVTPKQAIGKLLYVLHCNNSEFEIRNGDCTISSPSHKCVKAVELKNNEEAMWNYTYVFRSGVYRHICSSVALLSLNPMSENSYTLRGWLSSNTIIPGDSGLIIYAEIASLSNRLLKQAYRVGARISGPGIMKPIDIELLDNGNGDPDTKKGDGIFSRYFTLFEEKGTYVVSVFSSVATPEEAMFVTGYSSKKAITPVQTKIVGFFTVLKKPPPVDIIPPNRICDLKVISVNHENNTVELQWTAPGNDYDYGNAAGYDVYITEDWKDLQDSMLTKILPQKLRDAEALKPQDAGEKEQRKFTLEKKPEPVLYYIAVRGIDNIGNKAKLSNVIQVFIRKLEDATSIDTVENNTKNSTDSPTESTLKSHLSMDDFRFYILAAALSAVILIVILINILIWVFCLKKYKAKCATDRAAKDASENKEIPPCHSTENSILNSNYGKQHGYVNRAMIQSTSGTDEQNRELEHISIGNPSVLYGKVNKKEKTKNLTKSRSQEHEFETRKSLHIHQNEEDDLGLV
ncbi:uncharacterized protein LOC118187988 isoform X2 [Stegodyphus dumicola]|uniref:uncharacterized protein LOC118187988 isoform X2 n=1 Tax=Stegodyphus dumicola TaxID=202533 RepID=UPI0015A8CCFD|nr:uncharacterized protein LOC118187988 isoform X2 [Stegodyphus dumicola]